MECSICLNEMKEDQCIFTLSCNHKLHYSCFLKYSFQKNHIFIDCPLCREMNINSKKPLNDPETNLREICSHKKPKRCQAINNTNGLRCKNKACLLNYGFCSVHHPDILPKDKYELMNTYIHYMLQVKARWFTKLHFIDMIKKVLIKYPEINTFGEILTFGLRYKCHRAKLFQNEDIVEKE